MNSDIPVHHCYFNTIIKSFTSFNILNVLTLKIVQVVFYCN